MGGALPTLFGLKTCDTCRKAAKSLEAGGATVTFVDVRQSPLDVEQLTALIEAFGEALVNRRSTTWRGLTEAERQRSPLELLRDHPTLMKRPVLQTGATLTLGWDKDIEARHLGTAA